MTDVLHTTAAPIAYLVSAVSFFLGLKSLVKIRTAGLGRPLIALGLGLALLGGVLETGLGDVLSALPFVALAAVVGGVLGLRLGTSPIPARVAFIPGLAGAGGSLVAVGELLASTEKSLGDLVAFGLAAFLGAAALLVGIGLSLRTRETARSTAGAAVVVVLAGWATAALGFGLGNAILLVIGGVAGTAGLSLGRIVAAAAGRSLPALLTGAPSGAEQSGYSNVRTCGAEEAAMTLENASHVLIIPGFGMAAAQAQHAVKELGELLEKNGTQVTWVVHPSAGCIPGHMNAALDEADVPRDHVLELSEAGDAIAAADAALVVGANDVVNPAAMSDPQSPVYGMPVPDLGGVRSVFVIKRSLRPGACGVRNALFEHANTTLIFGDAKRVAQALVAELKGGGGH
jgi:NAD(P) transhydrogenase subunit beta